jgi:hypothetical protein
LGEAITLGGKMSLTLKTNKISPPPPKFADADASEYKQSVVNKVRIK